MRIISISLLLLLLNPAIRVAECVPNLFPHRTTTTRRRSSPSLDRRGESDDFAAQLVHMKRDAENNKKKKKSSFWSSDDNTQQNNKKDNLVELPNDISERAIRSLVKEILKDPSINIPMIPDYLEGKLYHTTIRLTLSAIYKGLKHAMDDKQVFSEYSVKLKHDPSVLGQTAAFQTATAMGRSEIDDKLLMQVADRLLSNQNINQPLIPDVLERQIYSNCLKVIFHVLDIVTNSFRVTICGHSIGIYLHKNNNDHSHQDEQETKKKKNALLRRSTKNFVDDVTSTSQLQELAKASGIEELILTSQINRRGVRKKHQSFLSQMHATLYGLTLGIVQDMIDNTALEFVGLGKIIMELVPTNSTATSSEYPTAPSNVAVTKSSPNHNSGTMAIFVSNLLVGFLLRAAFECINPRELWRTGLSKVRMACHSVLDGVVARRNRKRGRKNTDHE
mmetsp:Transcript_12254/g.18794  ORF Transcript_12254/g.18794 Transcript_12254/m.18794 type:complete len:448 (+) Transcript_12254:146-1489(+)|eukprot:CAMPEP_0178909006 /NCGR_PEP_ID=MMETSP0786-20121207/8246_1 /TAXON_ID=186022 /ORGANISM="Thalassionema frauenfeldii, Strain CCMP 1798" /LENGTH=447 /DNA_ID=CAMNT_0020580987 /DNA_START=139 /DNA_END=1482 /DNA_ORIENTATION=+